MRLHHGIGQQYHRVENDVKAHNGHQLGGERQIFAAVTAKQCGDRPCQSGKTEDTGHTDQSHDPGSGLFRCFGGFVIQQRQTGSDGGDDGDGDGRDKGTGHIVDGLAHIVDALHIVGLCLCQTQTQQLPHVDFGFQHGQYLQTGGADGDGNGDGQQPAGGLGIGFRLIRGRRETVVGTAELAEQVDGGDQTADGDTQNGTACGQRNHAGAFEQKQRGQHTHDELDECLQHLGNRGGQHISVPLEETPEG